MDGTQPHTSGVEADIERGFPGRIVKGREFEDKIFDDLQKWGFIVARNGTEHTCRAFVDAIRNSVDQTSLAMRYQPDGVIAYGCPLKTAYVEAKSSLFIERAAYEQYIKLSNAGNNIFIVMNSGVEIKFSTAQSITFTKQHPGKMNWPIINGWVSPRSDTEYEIKKEKHPEWHGSGTDYAIVDFSSMMLWEIFPSLLIVCR